MHKTAELDFFIEGFLLHQRSLAHSPNTVFFYKRNLDKFLWWLDSQHIPHRLESLDPNTLRSFMVYLQDSDHRWGSHNPTAHKPLSLGGVHAYGRSLKAFFNWVSEEAGIDNPMARVPLPRLPNQWKVKTWNPTEVRTLFEAASQASTLFLSTRDRALLSILLDSGLRASEVLSLRLEDVSIEAGGFQVVGKGRKRRTVILGQFARHELWEYLKERRKLGGDALFVSERQGTPALRYTGLRQLFERLKVRSGITRVPVHAHIARHTAATLMHRNGMSGASLQEIMGHAQYTTTKRYYLDIEEQDLIDEHSKASPLDNMTIGAAHTQRRKLPSPEVLLREVERGSYRSVGRKYGYSDTGIKNRLKRAGLK